MPNIQQRLRQTAQGGVQRAIGRVLFGLLAWALVFVLVGCSADADPIFPTPRPTVTVTITPTVTLTEPPSATSTPLLITFSPTAGPSPTALIGATSTFPAQSLPTMTLAPPPIAPGSLNIEYFTTDATGVHPGDSLTLYWSVTGANHAVIYRLNPDNSHAQLWQVSQSGSLVVTTQTNDRIQVRFALSVGDSLSRIEQTLTVPIGCAGTDWFFAPAPDSCPAAPPTFTSAAGQSFEHGQMLWLSTQGQIYVLFNDGKAPAWAAYVDTFKDGQPDRDPSINPPANLLQPIRGFGLVWRTQPHVRDRLGWAVNTEAGFDGSYQSDSAAVPGSTLYVRGQNGSVFALSSKDQTWKAIAATTLTATPTGTHTP